VLLYQWVTKNKKLANILYKVSNKHFWGVCEPIWPLGNNDCKTQRFSEFRRVLPSFPCSHSYSNSCSGGNNFNSYKKKKTANFLYFSLRSAYTIMALLWVCSACRLCNRVVIFCYLNTACNPDNMR
jgi:hypothetical protein